MSFLSDCGHNEMIQFSKFPALTATTVVVYICFLFFFRRNSSPHCLILITSGFRRLGQSMKKKIIHLPKSEGQGIPSIFYGKIFHFCLPPRTKTTMTNLVTKSSYVLEKLGKKSPKVSALTIVCITVLVLLQGFQWVLKIKYPWTWPRCKYKRCSGVWTSQSNNKLAFCFNMISMSV